MNNSVYDAASEQVRGKFVKLQKPLQHVAQPSRWPIAMRPKRAAPRARSLARGRAFEIGLVDDRLVEAQHGPVAVLACVAGGPFLTPERRPSIVETTTETGCARKRSTPAAVLVHPGNAASTDAKSGRHGRIITI